VLVRAGLAVVAVVASAAVLVQAFDASLGGSTGGGERSSSYATGPDGVAAWAELLERFGHRVEHRRESIGSGDLDADSTLVVLDPDALDDRATRAARTFVESGGLLVAGGAQLVGALSPVVPDPPRAVATSRHVFDDIAPGVGLDGVRTVRADGGTAWRVGGGVDVLVAGGDDVLLARATVGRGSVLLLADATVVHNRAIAAVDNAAVALFLAGGATRTVVFAEHEHGYGSAGGLGALPRRWQWALVLLGAATVAAMWARGRRLGPPEDTARTLPPPRAAYVEAIAVTLQRADARDDVAERVSSAVRARLAARGALGPEPPRERLVEQARHARLTEHEIRVVLDGARDDADLLAAGRALAAVQGWGHDAEGDG
jgi:hypothetical protein